MSQSIQPAEKTELRKRVEHIIETLQGGMHHHFEKFHEENIGSVYHTVRTRIHMSGLATYDFDLLTVLVVMAHDYAVRIGINSGGPSHVYLSFHQRTREGNGMERHPQLDEAVIRIRERAAKWAPKAVEVDPDLGKIGPGYVCKHGVRWPHECALCEDAAWKAFSQ